MAEVKPEGGVQVPEVEAKRDTPAESAPLDAVPKDPAESVATAVEEPGKKDNEPPTASETPTKDEKTEQPQKQAALSKRSSKKGDYRSNVKFDPSALETTDNPDEIRKQVEFYLSDSNLLSDKFLFEKVGGAKNNPVKISVIHSFKRMMRFQPYSAVVAALKDSKVLDVTEDESVQRKIPLDVPVSVSTDEARMKMAEAEAMDRSIYAKGFGQEGPTTQFDIEAFFTAFGTTNAIRLRRRFNKWFKGSVYVEFVDEATQQAFLALDPKPKWQGNDLVIKSKREYFAEKFAEFGEYPDQGHRAQRNDWKNKRGTDQKNGFSRGSRGSKRGRGYGGPRRGAQNGKQSHGDRRTRDRNDEESKPSNEESTTDDTPAVKAEPEVEAEARPPIKEETTTNDTAAKGTKRAREDDPVSQEGSRKKAEVKSEDVKQEAD
ncbi:MAG: hypothetical protein M4579_000689 [Chaenotheca gracillima]|nr:MAG: hypothetical protein M4579_000689 [Chaenotheca gracillima]